MTVQIREYQPGDEEPAVALWVARGLTRPWNDPRSDLRRAHQAQPGLLLVAELQGELVGTVMGGYDGHRGWMYYLASSAAHAGRGIGRALVAEVERRLASLGCPKVQLMVRSENAAAAQYYEQLGYADGDVAVLGKWL